MAVTLTTSWQTVASYKHIFAGSANGNNVTFYLEARIGGTDATAGTATLYTRLRSAVSHTGWGGAGNKFKFTCDYAGEYTSAYEWYYANEVMLESSSPATINYDVTGTKTFKLNATVYDSSSHIGINPTVTISGDVTLPTITTYNLTVKGNLDGNVVTDTSGYGTFAVSINGGSASRVTSFSKNFIYGTKYVITAYPNTGKAYNGVSTGAMSGTMTAATTTTIKFGSIKYYITYNMNGGTNSSSNPSSFYYGNTITLSNPTRAGYTFTGWTTSGGTLSGSTLTPPASDITLTANWSINTYTNTIHHYAAGFTKGEGNSGANRQFVFLGDTSFTATYGSTITYDSSKFTTIPNGYTWTAMGGNSFDSSWVGYPLGQQFSQPAKNTAMQFDYHPIPYTITYNLDGGTNHSSNPTSYNVVYGVTFAEPTKEGYTFTGWTIDGVSVTGINAGVTSTFVNATALYNGLATRTIGNKTVVAHWKKNEVSGKIPVKVNGEWKTGIPHVKQSGKWKKGKKVYIKKEGVWVLSK